MYFTVTNLGVPVLVLSVVDISEFLHFFFHNRWPMFLSEMYVFYP